MGLGVCISERASSEDEDSRGRASVEGGDACADCARVAALQNIATTMVKPQIDLRMTCLQMHDDFFPFSGVNCTDVHTDSLVVTSTNKLTRGQVRSVGVASKPFLGLFHLRARPLESFRGVSPV
jgi:hypothetical protein